MKKTIGMLMLAVLAAGVAAAGDAREAVRNKAEGLYMVIDLSEGPDATRYSVSYLDAVPEGGWTDDYKTTKLVMRRIPAGTFTMGSPEDELGRENYEAYEAQRQVTLTKDFYIGVFQVSQRQWERVMGYWPSRFRNVAYRDSRPVECVSFFCIREEAYSNMPISPTWPQSSAVGPSSFVGKMRARTGLSTLDLPTDAQREYAGRAGTTTALNSGKNLSDEKPCPFMSELGRYGSNQPDGLSWRERESTAGTAKVGSYLPNAWGLYDMHGNVWEWCLDWFAATASGSVDPVGAASGWARQLRGGCWHNPAHQCRSASHIWREPDFQNARVGFRLAMFLP